MNSKIMRNVAGWILLNPAPAVFSSASPRRRGFVVGGIVSICLSLAGLAGGTELHATASHKTMADYLRVLPAYVEWPTNTFATPEEPWRIGVLGNDPFGGVLEKTLRDQRVAGRGFEIWHAAKLPDLPPCEIIFIAGKDAKELKKILRELGLRPVLTVSEHDNFLALGGVIQLSAHPQVRMAINLDRARAAGLKIPGKILEVASEVIENGGSRTIKK